MALAFKIKGLREERGRIRTQIEAIGSAIRKEARAMTPDERERFGRLTRELERTSDEIKVAEHELENGRPDSDPRPGRHDVSHAPCRYDDETDEDRRDRGIAFHGWARCQYGIPLTPRHERACARVGVDPRGKEFCFPLQKRSLTTQTGSSGGYTIAQDFSSALTIALKSYSGVRGVCDEFMTETGADMPYPSVDDTGVTGERVSENTEVAYEDPTFSSVTFKAYKTSSKAILVPRELLQDAAFDLDAILGRLMGERIGRFQGAKFTTGAGTTEEKGIVTCSTLGVTTAAAAAITATELTQLAFSVDPAYHSSPRCGYMMHSTIASYLMTLKDANGHPLLRESFADGVLSMRINGFPVSFNQHMEPAVSGVPVTAKKHIIFGDMTRFHVRDSGPVRIYRLEERWSEKDQVGFVGFLRSDSNCTDTNAIKHLLQA